MQLLTAAGLGLCVGPGMCVCLLCGNEQQVSPQRDECDVSEFVL